MDRSPEDQAGGAGDVLHVGVAGLRAQTAQAQPQPQQLERHQQHGGGWRGEETLVAADWNYWIVPAWPGPGLGQTVHRAHFMTQYTEQSIQN